MPVNAEALRQVLEAKQVGRLKLWLDICARCALCAPGCHFYQSDPRPEHVPAYRLKPLIEVLRRKETIDDEVLQRLCDVDYGTCTMCQRCTLYCPYGIGIAFLVRVARSIAVSQGLTPPGLAAGSRNALEFGNNLGMTEEDYLETIAWQLEELQAEMPEAQAPMDRKGARLLVTFHPRDIKFYPQNLYSYLKIYNASGEDFTFTSQGWDATNLGLFSGDDKVAAHMAGRVVAAAESLGARTVATAE